jgi:DNA-damage-inducible protein D
MDETRIALFKKKEIRKVIHNNEWWFSILDVISVLTDSPQPKTYWAKMKERDKEMSQPFPFWEQLKLIAEDGKMRETDCDRYPKIKTLFTPRLIV